MNRPLTKRGIRNALRFATDAELAGFFGVSASAVSQWPEDEPIPELRQLQAERKRPELFGPEPDPARRRAAAGQDAQAAATTQVETRPLSEAA